MPESLESKVQRLNRYDQRGWIKRFDRLYAPLCREAEQSGQELRYQRGRYTLQERTFENDGLPDWIARS